MEANIVSKFEEIYSTESDTIFRFCLVRVSNREQALDITQETFVRFWQTLQQKKEIKNNRAFIFTVANRLIIDWYRKKKSLSLDDIMTTDDGDMAFDQPDEGAGSSLDLGSEGRLLLEKISELSPEHRLVVYMRFVEDLSPQEISQILEISANAVSVRINRGLEELRQKTGYKIDEKN